MNDPFKVALKASKLPMTLLKDSEKSEAMDLLKVESFKETFGGKAIRKKPKLLELKPKNQLGMTLLSGEVKEQDTGAEAAAFKHAEVRARAIFL